jgi:glycosyltransferase involved in cell wall biosynthesis
MPNLLIVNHYAQAPDGPGSTRHYSIAKYLAAFGWHTTILASSADLYTGRRRSLADAIADIEDFGEVKFAWLRCPEYRGNGAGRIVNMLAFAYRVLQRRLTPELRHPHVTVGSTVHPLAAWAAWRLARRYRAPYVFEIRDLWPETLIAMGRLSGRGITARVMRAVERRLATNAAHIVSVLPNAASYLGGYGIADEKVSWIPNGVDCADYDLCPEPVTAADFRVLYVGAHGNANALHTLLQAMAIIQQGGSDRIRCRLFGDGPRKPVLMEYARSLNLGNVEFSDPIAKRDVGSLAAQADAFVLCSLSLPRLYRYGVSMNKLYDYMAMGRPTVVAMEAANNPVEEANAGLTVPPENPRALADAIVRLSSMSYGQRRLLGLNARKHVVENHDYRVLARRYNDVLKTLLAATPSEGT